MGILINRSEKSDFSVYRLNENTASPKSDLFFFSVTLYFSTLKNMKYERIHFCIMKMFHLDTRVQGRED